MHYGTTSAQLKDTCSSSSPNTPRLPVIHTSTQLVHQDMPHLAGFLYSTHSRGGSRNVVGVIPIAPNRPYSQQE